MKNTCKEKMLRGEKVVGTFFEMGGANAVECLGLAGLDFLIVDTEHGPFDPESTVDLVRAAHLRGITPLARVQDSTRPSVLKMLDIGIQGLIVPSVQSADEVRSLVEYAKYYPLGKRGVAFGREAGWGAAEFAAGSLESYFEICNRETMLIPQCETLGCLEQIEEIAALDGVDGIFIGPYDLSTALGIPGQFQNPAFLQAVERIVRACKASGKFVTIYANNAAESRAYFERGFDGVAVATDTSHYIQVFRQLLADIRA